MGTYVQTKFWCKLHANLLKNISKNSEKNHECASQLTSFIYKISWSNSSYPRSYKKKTNFLTNSNGSNAPQISLFCNF